MVLAVVGCGEVPKLKNGEEAVVTFKDSSKNISVEKLYDTLKDKYGIDNIIEMVDTIILNEQMRQYYNNESEFLEYIQGYGYETVDELKVALSLNYKRGLAAKDYAKSIVTDKEVEDYYNNKVVGDITASHILIKPKTGSNFTDEETKKAKEEALKKAKEVITKLNNGAKFEELAKEYSDDEATKSKGGNLGTFNIGTMEEAFEKASIALEVNKYTTTPVETGYGYHIILKTAQKDKPKLSKVKNNIIDTLADEKLNSSTTLTATALVELRKSYGFKIVDSDLSDSYNNIVNNIK
jgi:foldase protein PrsA